MQKTIDIKQLESAPVEKTLCLDANVLYFIYFADFRTLRRYSKYQGPPDNLIQQYTNWIQKSVEQGCSLVTSFITASEFLKTVEHVVLEREFLLGGGTEFRGKHKKEQRLKSTDAREEIFGYFSNLRKTVELIPHSNLRNVPTSSFDRWFETTCDIFDATLVEHGKLFNFDMFVSEDGDFSEFDDITICTANSNILK